MKTKTIAIMNHKGGCGKTTTAANVADAMARRGLSVLLVDLDPQANLTYYLNGDEPVDRGVYDVMFDGGELPIIKRKTNMYIVPSTAEVANVDTIMELSRQNTTRLSKVLDPVRGVFNYILLDCPPGLGVLTYNAVVAAEHVIVTMEPCLLSNQGLDSTVRIVQNIRNKAETTAVVDGIVLTRYKGRRLHNSIENMVRGEYGDIVFHTMIRENIALAECTLFNKTAYEYNKNCNGAKDYTALTREIVNRYEVKL